MEYFDGRQSGAAEVKEKSVYTLHLDTPRIIIVAAAIIGVVAAAFIFGMRLVSDDKPTTTADDLLAAQSMNIPAPPHSSIEGITPPKAEGEAMLHSEILASQTGVGQTTGDGVKTTDALPSADVDVLLPSGFESEQKLSEPTITKTTRKASNMKTTAKTSSKKKKEQAAAKKTKTSKTAKAKLPAKTAEKKSGVVAAVYESPAKVKKTGFAVQIASFDKRANAQNEAERLKKQSYAAYIDATSVDGKQFFRVRIGPLSSKEKAAALLSELQEDGGYDESYIVKQ